VRLAADIEQAGPGDRVLLALGGRWWLQRRFASTLDHLARELSGRASEPEPPVRRFGRAEVS
jgi:hypothetical protein